MITIHYKDYTISVFKVSDTEYGNGMEAIFYRPKGGLMADVHKLVYYGNLSHRAMACKAKRVIEALIYGQ